MPEELARVDYGYVTSVSKGANLHFLAGACPLDSEGRVLFDADCAAQTRQCFRNALAVLGAGGMTEKNICFIRVLVASCDRSDLVAAWHALRELLPDMPPATLQGVTVLGYEKQLVELEITAYS